MTDFGEESLDFAGEAPAGGATGQPWQILVVDDDPDIHTATRLALDGLRYAGRDLQVLRAESAGRAREVLAAHRDVALVLLDVVMESDAAGFDVVRFIREELKNDLVRIVIRTGQPGAEATRDLVARYKVDDYRTKLEMTFEHLRTIVISSLRTFDLLRQLDQQRRDLLDANLQLEQFAYFAAHDLQAPLRGIAGFARILRNSEHLDDRCVSLVEDILASGAELQMLVQDLLQLSRLGRGAMEWGEIALGPVVERALRAMEPELSSRRARITVDPLPTIRGSARQLGQLFRNLVENGTKFQRSTEPQVHISCRREDGGWRIGVSDNGIGIAPGDLQRIFEPFRRLHARDEFPGTGLGLSICRKVVELHGGTLRVESTVGEGTTFKVRLPSLGPPNDVLPAGGAVHFGVAASEAESSG